MKTMSRVVVKIGSSSLMQGIPSLLSLVQQIVQFQGQGLQVVLVSSGAVATGREFFKTSSQPTKQTLASIGQVKLMQVWAELFARFELQVGQVLLTKEDFSQTRRRLTKETIDSLLQHQIIPIINENDTVATQETGVGDNDNLAALVAAVIAADTLILLTDQEGLYTADPRHDPEATLISQVGKIDEKILALAGSAATMVGTGGMVTKLEAAQVAARSYTQTIIASSTRPNVLLDLLAGKQIGTLFG